VNVIIAVVFITITTRLFFLQSRLCAHYNNNKESAMWPCDFNFILASFLFLNNFTFFLFHLFIYLRLKIVVRKVFFLFHWKAWHELTSFVFLLPHLKWERFWNNFILYSKVVFILLLLINSLDECPEKEDLCVVIRIWVGRWMRGSSIREVALEREFIFASYQNLESFLESCTCELKLQRRNLY
jgi:hypothetical protein